MDQVWTGCQAAGTSAMAQLMAAYDTESRRTEHNVVYRTLEDFRRCPVDVPKMVAIGCTGAGKSTLLNVIAGNRFVQRSDFTWKWSEPPLFTATHGCSAVTRATSYAIVDWFADKKRPLLVVDTPGHDDTEGRNIDSKESRDVLRAQAADLHNKLKSMESVNALVVLHNQASSNRLNPATYAILQMINEKFGPSIWRNVIVAYSQCNHHTEASWKSDIEQKSQELQQEIRKQFPDCITNVPVIALGGGLRDDDYTTELECDPGFERLWEFVSQSEQVSTVDLQPFEGAHWRKYEVMVERQDEAVAKADAAVVYMSVMLKLAALLLFFFWRAVLLPDWTSVLLLNIPYTMVDELSFLLLVVGLMGPVKCKYSLLFFYDQWVKPWKARAANAASLKAET